MSRTDQNKLIARTVSNIVVIAGAIFLFARTWNALQNLASNTDPTALRQLLKPAEVAALLALISAGSRVVFSCLELGLTRLKRADWFLLLPMGFAFPIALIAYGGSAAALVGIFIVIASVPIQDLTLHFLSKRQNVHSALASVNSD